MKSRWVVFFSAAALSALACSNSPPDPYGPSPDFGAIDAQFKNPTGTFAPGSESNVFSAYGQQTQNGSVASGFFPQSGSSTTTKSVRFGALHTLGLHALADATSTDSAFCTPGMGGSNGQGSCNCPGGGVIDWDFSGMASGNQQSGKFDAVLKLAAQGCKSADAKESLDGKAFMDMHGDYTQSAGANGTTSQGGSLTLIYDAHFAYASPTASGNIDMVYELADSNGSSTFDFLVNVPDGTVVVGGSWDATAKTGTLTITDKTDTWTCDGTDGKTVTCTNKEGQSRTANL